MTTLAPKIRNHYLAFSTFTNPGLYKQKLIDDLPSDIRELGLLVRKNIIHRTTLTAGNTGTNADLRFGDMKQVPWWRQAEDDILVTAAAMLAELYRRDERGLVIDRAPEDKLVLTCRYVSILMATILKSKGIPTRVRSGNAPYFGSDAKLGHVSYDHWLDQYWNDKEGRWVTIDIDGSLSLEEDFDPYDVPDGKFDFPAKAWLDVRAGKDDANRFYNAADFRGEIVIAWSLFYDFHSIMNSEPIYQHHPNLVRVQNFPNLTKAQLEEIDELAELMLDVDGNFEKLQAIWENKKEFRLLGGSLL
ncbi:MAG TPA: transglutaminase domain-containing protein [Candidatus Saccharimonadales bacterium]|nr:transglutaminase domain-containing protein [Candidatus Saccharimonadales bacterium]